jgi:hypothetical protein
MEKINAFQVSKGWYYALTAMLVVVLLFSLADTMGIGSVNTYIQIKVHESIDNIMEYLNLQTVMGYLSTFCYIVIYLLFIVVYSKYALVSRQQSAGISVGFWVLVLFSVLTLLHTLCYPIMTVFIASTGDYDLVSKGFEALSLTGNIIFVIRSLAILVLGVALVVVGLGRLRTGGILVAIAMVCALLYFPLRFVWDKLAPSDLMWLSSLFNIVVYSLVNIVLVVGLLRMYRRSDVQ